MTSRPVHSSDKAAAKTVAYLVNQYPKVSHSFIRREVQAIERQGFNVHRFAVRGNRDELADEADSAERQRTRYLLGGSVLPLALATFALLFKAPGRFFIALRLAVRMGSRADRPTVIHLVYLAEAALLVRWMRQAQVQHLHAHFGTNPATVALLAHLLGGPTFSFTVHGPEEFDKPEFIHLGLKIEYASFVVAISSFGRSQLFRWLPRAHWAKVKLVHCGLESAFYEVPPSPPNATARLVCVGRLCEQKGQLLLVKAMALVKAQGIDVELVLAGDGEMRTDVEELIAHLNLADRVRITGWISSTQVREEILAARALVLPSFAEGLPVVIMEAMALRRPVISTYIAGIPELLVHGESGWLVPAGDLESLVLAIEICLRLTAAELRHMGDLAHERVLKQHHVDSEAEKLADHFNAAIAASLLPMSVTQ